jgi:hypothetical protein
MDTPSSMIPALPPGASGWRISGVYRRSPLAGSYYPAELECVPMTRPQEYAQAALFEQPCDAPVIVSLSQRLRILAELVRGLREHVPGLSCVLVRLYGPDFNVALPADLLAADVLLVHDPLEALPTVLAAERHNIALIQQDLRADGPERGHNALSVMLLQPGPPGAAAGRLQAWMDGSPLLQAMSGLRLEPVGEGSAS